MIAVVLLIANTLASSSTLLYDTHISNVQPLTSLSSIAADVSWEFTNGLEGWASATYNEMQAEVYHKNGELRANVNGNEPHFDSPPLFLPIEDATRHVVVIRYRYIGRCNHGKIRLRGGTSISDFIVDYGHSNWDRSLANDTHYFSPDDIAFSIVGDGKWKIAYAYLYHMKKSTIDTDSYIFNGNLTQMRIWPATTTDGISPNKGNSFHIDWIRIIRAPIIERIKGCHGEKYSNFTDFFEQYSNVESKSTDVNGNVFLKKHKTIWKVSNDYRYTKVYNCLREGGERIIIEGRNLGTAPALVYIDKKPCTHVQHDKSRPQERLSCITPAAIGDASFRRDSLVEIKNGKFPGLFDTSSFFSYASLPPKPVDVRAANIASRSIDLHWKVGGSTWDQMTQTGFLIQWKKQNLNAWESSTITGNVTCTTIQNLQPNTSYTIGISSLTENQAIEQDVNIYGQRKKSSKPLIQSYPSILTTKTLYLDVAFDKFNANLTHNYGPLDKERNELGPTGITSGEGHYGLSLVGDANIENCNASSTCCDTFEGSFCDATSCFCHKGILSFNVPRGNVSYICGPALRLTGSHAGLKGAAWYTRQLEVSEGFDTEFIFRISNPSFRCNNMNKVQTNCRYRGADGFAFLIQAQSDQEIGGFGKNLGYGGINNSIAIEFDTYHNYETLDPYENHISIQTRGWKYANSPNHQYSLGYTNALSDLSNGMKKVRIRYVPKFDPKELTKSSFMAPPYLLNFFQKANYSNDPISDWSASPVGSEDIVGMLYIYFENLVDPILVVPLNIAATLKLNYGRAWIGFTSSTGSETWQVHDIVEWKFSSLRIN